MTFPRRLTPSDTERATIVQQRMAPGGALGVGSRHVRSGQQPPSNGSSVGASGVVSAATYELPNTATTATGGLFFPTGAVIDTIGDYAADFDPSSPAFLNDGQYQIAFRVFVDTTDGVKAEALLDIDNFAVTGGNGAYGRASDIVYGGTGWPYVISPVIEVAANQAVSALWLLNDGDGSATGTSVGGWIRIVRFA